MKDEDFEAGAADTAELTDRALRDGDTAALAELYTRTLPALLAWIRIQKSGGMALHIEPDDFVQEVWIRLLENRSSHDPAKGSFQGWMFGFAKRVWMEVSNPTRKAHRALPVGKETAIHRAPDSITSVSRALMRDETIQKLNEYVATLDDVDRGVLVHYGLEQMSCAQVSRRLGISEDLVSKRWQRGLVRMRESGFGRYFA
ncbi:MAG: sigma-70 family RNA polymerase sigma factor [Planctomycetes bacterium]|nr:sigma-70 family RNA polymerase sigma factor [Planctomycetota bacterium]